MNRSAVLAQLKEIFGDTYVIYDQETLKGKSCDLWPRNLFGTDEGKMPSAVVTPSGDYLDQISRLVKLAVKEKIGLVVRGGGSGVCGAANTSGGEIVIDTTQLDKIALIEKPNLGEDGLVMAEAGVFGHKLEEFLNEKDFTCGHQPASLKLSTVGGWVSTRSNGQFSIHFGNVENLVTKVEGFNGKGELMSLEGDELKKVFRLEGTTFIATKIWLKVFKIFKHDAFYAVRFRSLERVVDFLRHLALSRKIFENCGARITAARAYDFVDYHFMSRPHKKESLKSSWIKKLKRNFEKIICGLPRLTAAILSGKANYWMTIVYLQADSSHGLIQADLMLEAIIRARRGLFQNPIIAETWFSNRFKLGYDKIIDCFKIGMMVDTFECESNWGNLERNYLEIRKKLFRFGIAGAHIGLDRNQPYLYFIFGALGKSKEKYDRIWQEILLACIECGTLTTHHHGVGLLKAGANNVLTRHAYGQKWYEEVALPAKREMDPFNILNPGKLFS